MKAITLRNLPPEVARRLARKAEEEGISLNRAVIASLEDAFGVARRKKGQVYHDLDFMVGALSKQEADELDRAVKKQRRVDPEVWA